MGIFTYVGKAELIAKAAFAVRGAVIEIAEDFVGQAQADTPVDTGALKASIHVESIEGGAINPTATVATGGEASEYAIPVHQGWRPHWIEAGTSGFLWWPGAAHPVERVFNPGHSAFKYMADPLIANRGLYLLAMSRAAAGEF